jgi:hypothetical protein
MPRPFLARAVDTAMDRSVVLGYAVEPVPPTGRFWHDRVERPTHLLPTTHASDRARTRAWAWLCGAAGLDDAAPLGWRGC